MNVITNYIIYAITLSSDDSYAHGLPQHQRGTHTRTTQWELSGNIKNDSIVA